MPHSSGQLRGPYATTACTNCRRKHAKCSEEVTCTYCISHGLKCVYVKSVKKRGPKTTNKSNGFESNFNETVNIEQDHTFNSNEIQFSKFIPPYFNYGEELQPIQNEYQNFHAPREIIPFFKAITNNIMQNNYLDSP
ncbi:11972_t:CDS:2, partial [Dentiscutata heterogama]